MDVDFKMLIALNTQNIVLTDTNKHEISLKLNMRLARGVNRE